MLNFDVKNMTPLLIIGIVVVVLIIGWIFIYFFVIKKNSYDKKQKNFENQYYELHNLLTGDIDSLIARVQTISSKNPDYVAYYDKYHSLYQDILMNNDRPAYMAIFSNRDPKDKKKSYLESIKKILAEYEKRVKELHSFLNNLLSKDEELRNNMSVLQRRFRELKENYSNNNEALSVMASSFDKIFIALENRFNDVDELFTSASYTEAYAKLDDIEKILVEFEKIMGELPNICIRVCRVLPNLMSEIKNKYEGLKDNSYPLSHLKVDTKLNDYKQNLDDILKRVQTFNINGVNQEIDQIDSELNNILKSFQDEEDAKKYYDDNNEEIYKDAYKAEGQCKEIKRILPNYLRAYVIKDKYLEKKEELENVINEIKQTEITLDSYTISTSRQPYSLIRDNLMKVDNKKNYAFEIIKDINTYLNSLKVDAQNDYQKCCSYFLKLKESESILRNMQVDALKDQYALRFEACYQSLEDVANILNKQPIDVAKANEIVEDASVNFDNIINEIENLEKQRKYAEESIVYANQYRLEFSDCNNQLENAGLSFFEGDFTRTIDTTTIILKKIKANEKEG